MRSVREVASPARLITSSVAAHPAASLATPAQRHSNHKMLCLPDSVCHIACMQASGHPSPPLNLCAIDHADRAYMEATARSRKVNITGSNALRFLSDTGLLHADCFLIRGPAHALLQPFLRGWRWRKVKLHEIREAQHR